MIRATAAALLLTGACATAPRATSPDCPRAWGHVESTLRAGLARYEEGLGRYVAATVPGADVSAGHARAAVAADRWAGAHRAPFLARCRAAGPELAACVERAAAPDALHACGLGGEVESFSDEVLPAFAMDPMGQAAKGGGAGAP